jgi:hypothetical protein
MRLDLRVPFDVAGATQKLDRRVVGSEMVANLRRAPASLAPLPLDADVYTGVVAELLYRRILGSGAWHV